MANILEDFLNRILRAESWDELQDLTREYSNSDLSEDDKFFLGASVRVRFGNYIQFKK